MTREFNSTWIEPAAHVGQLLLKDSLWAGRKCNWLVPNKGRDNYSALGPDLYGGTAGVAWYLADLAAVTDSSSFRDYALGAVNFSLSCYEDQVEDARIGLFTGAAGAALSALYLSQVLDERSLYGRATKLLRGVVQEAIPCSRLDLADGQGGVLVAAAAWPDGMEIGSQKLRALESSFAAATTDVRYTRARLGYGGLLHGSAGIAYTLAKLSNFASGPDYQRIAVDHLECSRFSEESVPEAPSHMDSASATWEGAASWCHGAAGLLAVNKQLEAGQATAAYSTELVAMVCRALSRALSDWRSSKGLCHGIAGLVESVGETGLVFADSQDEVLRVEAVKVLASLVTEPQPDRRIFRETRRFGLYDGIAGLGRAMLCMHTPSLGSPLSFRFSG